jgi:hypothetical protein
VLNVAKRRPALGDCSFDYELIRGADAHGELAEPGETENLDSGLVIFD